MARVLKGSHSFTCTSRGIIIIIITGILEWPKQQRHHENHYSQSKYSRIRQCCNSSGISVFKWRRKVDRDGAEVTSSGKLFQTLAPAIKKTRLATVGRRKDGTSS